MIRMATDTDGHLGSPRPDGGELGFRRRCLRPDLEEESHPRRGPVVAVVGRHRNVGKSTAGEKTASCGGAAEQAVVCRTFPGVPGTGSPRGNAGSVGGLRYRTTRRLGTKTRRPRVCKVWWAASRPRGLAYAVRRTGPLPGGGPPGVGGRLRPPEGAGGLRQKAFARERSSTEKARCSWAATRLTPNEVEGRGRLVCGTASDGGSPLGERDARPLGWPTCSTGVMEVACRGVGRLHPVGGRFRGGLRPASGARPKRSGKKSSAC